MKEPYASRRKEPRAAFRALLHGARCTVGMAMGRALGRYMARSAHSRRRGARETGAEESKRGEQSGARETGAEESRRDLRAPAAAEEDGGGARCGTRNGARPAVEADTPPRPPPPPSPA